MRCVAFGGFFCARVLNPSKRRVVVALRLSLWMAPSVAVRSRAVPLHVDLGATSRSGIFSVLVVMPRRKVMIAFWKRWGGEKNVVKPEVRGKNK